MSVLLFPVTNTKPMVVQPKPQLTTSVTTVVNKCHVTMNCMTSCAHGYTLGNTGKDGCPLCTCIQPHTSKPRRYEIVLSSQIDLYKINLIASSLQCFIISMPCKNIQTRNRIVSSMKSNFWLYIRTVKMCFLTFLITLDSL